MSRRQRSSRTVHIAFVLVVVTALLLMTSSGLAQPRGEPEGGDGDAGTGANGTGTDGDDSNATRGDPRDEMTEWEGLLLPPGVEGEVIASGLTFPTAIEWDDDDNLYVSLVGFSPNGRQIFRIENDSRTPLDLSGADLTEQILDITFHDGSLYFSTTGRIHVHDLDTDQSRTIVRDLPAWGDHRTNEIVFDADGRLYIGQGTVTNSGVVGFDQLGQPNAINNVSGERPAYHDIPCTNVRLSGWNWNTTNPMAVTTDRNADEGAGNDATLMRIHSEDEAQDIVESNRAANATAPSERAGLWLTWPDSDAERVVTGPFSPFATPTYRNQTVAGEPACNGAVLSMDRNGGDLRPVAWGFRNPFALKFDDQGRLWVSDNGPDQRGSRPLGPGPDTLQIVDVSANGDEVPWYGWPDFTLGYNYTHRFFTPMFGPPVVPVFAEPPSEPRVQFTWTGAHASANKFDFGRNDTTYADSLFSAEFGSLGSSTAIGALSGMAVTRVSLDDGRVTEFITGADRWSGDFRPVEAAFGPDDRLYVLEFGQVGFEGGEGNATHGERYIEQFVPETGRVLAFTLPDEMDWEGVPVGNPGGDGQNPNNGDYGPRRNNVAIVNVFDFGFSQEDPVEVGARVTFTNVGRIGHTATEEQKVFNSGFELAPRANFTWTPTEPGTYQFYCAVHPVMRGSITVLEEGATDGGDRNDTGGGTGNGDDQEDAPGVAAMLLVATLLATATAVRRSERGRDRP